MMLRDKKDNDVNTGKWIGIGGKFEAGETAGECLKREAKEETGADLSSFLFHGVIGFKNDEYEDEEMYLYSAFVSDEQAEAILKYDGCREGTLSFIPDGDIMKLNLWEGDRLFLKDLLSGDIRISYELIYEHGKLVKSRKIPISNVLFDLDGTLIDTGEGIMKCAEHSLKAIGVNVDDYRELSFFVGPPLVYTYTKRYGLDIKEARELVKLYRERYNQTGVYECELYPFVRECLMQLKSAGFGLYVASSKPENMCCLLLDHFGLTDLFDDVAGSTPDGRIDTKSQVLNELFRRRSYDPSFISGSILIGDTAFDIRGARDVGISSMGVSYGYGDAKEMSSLGAAAIADSLKNIPDIITRLR